MKPDYADILALAHRAPDWYDADGVPRYAPFNPKMCGVYSLYVAYMLVACQECGEQFYVAVDRNGLEVASSRFRLPTVESVGSFYYGDPPRHGGICLAGDTMNTEMLAVLEFWRLEALKDPVRLPECEVRYEGDTSWA